jgi:hypothetical protein
MTDNYGETDPVFVVQHDGQLHVMKSVASFPADGSGTADEKAAADQLRTIAGTAAVTPVDRAKLSSMPLLLF